MSKASYVRESASSLPLHELLSQLLRSKPVARRYVWRCAGTLQGLNHATEKRSLLDFINTSLRGIGQIAFANNPLSGLLILLAVGLQSGWVALSLVVGVVAATLTANRLKLDRPSVRNGIYGFNGALVGVALGTFGTWGNGSGNGFWLGVIALGAAVTTALMQKLGLWMAVHWKLPAMGIPFHIVAYLFLAIALYVPQPVFQIGAPPPFLNPAETLEGTRLLSALITGLGQIFFSGGLVSAVLVVLALALCSPMGAMVGVLGGAIGLMTGLALGADLNVLYAGLWSYNSALTAIAIGGIFYAPNLRSVAIASVGAFVTALVGWLLGLGLAPLGLPILAVPFHVGTYVCFLGLRRSLSSLVPVAPYAIASPEEHRWRYLTAKQLIAAFRQQLQDAMQGRSRQLLFEQASVAMRGDLRYVFDAIDRDGNGKLSLTELSQHFQQAGYLLKPDELNLAFISMDADRSGEIEFAEFGELLLRHRRLISHLQEFYTYFLPIDANGDGVLAPQEMNVVLASVDEPPLTQAEISFLRQRIGGKDFTWERFLELVLVI
ncbi:MAG: urea transporter [Oscillatoriophycideae cyanobacterium NC_groundwater_1537_Pr4_S-0.65um_50_18]|nr:urea transporter [Oscillatoriophycideae cyanobacterium NC_groundwater_1537_Pr4_S-0.65um_50_18]